MTLKKFAAPNIAVLLLLSLFWIGGIDRVVQTDEDELKKNLMKYVQTTKSVQDNYVEPVSLTSLFKSGIKGLVKNLDDSTATLEGTPADTTFSGELDISSITESTRRFENAYLYLANNYPDENMTERTEDAIRSLLSTLDPHSIYLEPEISEQEQEAFEGKFQGIGIQFNIIQDTITVVTAISGGPSDQLGIRSGDRIIAIEDSSALGFQNEDVRNALRGPKGSEVDVTIKRPGTSGTLKYTITRDEIPLHTVDASYMLDEQTGYIKISRFAATTHEEFMTAMRKLEDLGMERLMLDLRGNGGGYMSQAVAIAEEFFPGGTKLVSTKSRHARFTQDYFSSRTGNYTDMPVIVMVNETSASASEIVSGAIQDHDRGLIVGKRTYGKGLVQQQYALYDTSTIRVTISRYYTPSGRLIQKPYADGRENYVYEIYQRDNASSDAMEFTEHVPDSLKYHTDAGRTVYGGGGIVPDHPIQEDTTQSAAVVNFMRGKQVAFDFVRQYLDENGDTFRSEWANDYEGFREQFQWTDAQMDQVYGMLRENNMVVTDTVQSPEFRSDSLMVPPGHFEKVRWMSEGIMKAELALQVWDRKHYFPVFNDVFDNMLDKAMNLWDEVRALEEYAAAHTTGVNRGEGG
ncbi:MAG: S41 family peptidase [Balneolaceae bacterium]|nr:S41 family peptidase [Balneolaceae bacterium]